MDGDWPGLVGAAEEGSVILLLVLESVPPFMGLDGRCWRLAKGDLVTVNPGLPFKQAKILIEKNVARWIK